MRRALLQAGQTEEAKDLPVNVDIGIVGESLLIDFTRLSTTRNGGMGIMPISWLSVDSYAISRNYDEFMVYLLHRVIEELDPIYMEYINDKSKSKSNTNSNKPN